MLLAERRQRYARGWRQGQRLRGELVIRRRHLDLLHDGSDVLGQIRDLDRCHIGRLRTGSVQRHFVLHKSCRWSGDAAVPLIAISLKRDGGPGTPIRDRAIQIPAPRTNRNAAGSANGEAPPVGERSGIERLTLECSGPGEPRSDLVDLSDVAGAGEDAALRGDGEARGLRWRKTRELRVHIVGIEAVDAAAVTCTQQRMAGRVDGNCIHDVLSVAPDFVGLAVSVDAINIGAAGNQRRQKRRGWKRRSRGPCCAYLYGYGLPRAGGGLWDPRLRGRDDRRRSGARANSGSINDAIGSNFDRGDFAFRRLVQYESGSGRRDPQNQAAWFRTDDQVAALVDCERACVRFFGAEKHVTLAIGRDPMNLPAVTGGNVEVAGVVEGHGPDVLGVRIVIDAALAVARNSVDLPIRVGGGVDLIMLVDRDGVDFDPVQYRERAALAVGRNLEQLGMAAAVASAGGEESTLGIRCDRPEVGRRRIEHLADGRRQKHLAVATQGDIFEAAFVEIG